MKKNNIKNKILLLCPSRGRPDAAMRLSDNVKSTIADEHNVDLIFILDDDDPTINQYSGLNVEIVKNKIPGLVFPLNLIYSKYSKDYRMFGFVGDDVTYHTPHWDKIFINNFIENDYNNICYGNDMLRGDCLLTSFYIGNGILDKIKYMAYPKLNHVFVDTFWRLVGSKINKLNYFPNIIIKHNHYTIDTNTKFDDTYARTIPLDKIDKEIYLNFEKNELKNIIDILKD